MEHHILSILKSSALGLAALTLTVIAPAAEAQTFSNTAAIILPTSAADPRSPLYPSPIVVTGAPASIGYVSVTLSGLSHTYTSDVNALLISPTGQRILLMASACAAARAVDNTLTFVPDGTITLPDLSATVVSGVYACSVYNGAEAVPAPAPAPSGPYGTTLAPLIGTSANGTWNLYVWDGFPTADNGALAGGWSITFNQTPAQPLTTAFTYQGVLAANSTPINGNANVRFTLCSSATADLAFASVASPITRAFTGISGGRIATTLDIGSVIDTPQALWLNIDVDSPPGSGFVTLTPRQPITPAPQARVAQRAVLADTATTAISATNATNASNATNATQLVPGRARIRGDVGPSNGSPGIWFTSPIASPIERAFIGQRDDNNVGFFNNGWRLLVHNGGNIAIGNESGATPPERLTVSGSIQISTGTPAAPNRLAFGALGNLTDSPENNDAVYFQRINSSFNTTDLRLYVGNDPGLFDLQDTFSIWSTNGTPTGGTENFRFRSDGVAFRAGGGAWAALSDPRAKHDIAPLAGTLDKLLHLRGYSFLYNDDRIATGMARPGTQIGLMADEVAAVFPDWVSTDAAGTRYVTERATTALMVEALRDLRAEKDRQIDALKADAARRDTDAAKRDAENAELKARLTAIEAALLKPGANK